MSLSKKVASGEKGKQTEKDEIVITPGGPRLKSKVHHVEPGQHVDAAGGRLKIVDDATGRIVKDLGEVPKGKWAARRKTSSSATTRRGKKK
ncbi:MAG TPA: hypothetical protein VMT71_11105 [Syntrophorhabdales bacterium]|nr:hypothetical protein [Syntrophorhabdales bacterium]